MTVAEVLAALSGLPGHLPVMANVVMEDAEGPYSERESLVEVRWQGSHVELVCE